MCRISKCLGVGVHETQRESMRTEKERAKDAEMKAELHIPVLKSPNKPTRAVCSNEDVHPVTQSNIRSCSPTHTDTQTDGQTDARTYSHRHTLLISFSQDH